MIEKKLSLEEGELSPNPEIDEVIEACLNGEEHQTDSRADSVRYSALLYTEFDTISETNNVMIWIGEDGSFEAMFDVSAYPGEFKGHAYDGTERLRARGSLEEYDFDVETDLHEMYEEDGSVDRLADLALRIKHQLIERYEK